MEVGVLNALVAVHILLVLGCQLSLRRTGLRSILRRPVQRGVQAAALKAG